MSIEFGALGIRIPDILLPNPRVNLKQWAVVACDQYTSQPEYWGEVARLVEDTPSALNIIFPEVYLDKGKDREIIDRIQKQMRTYLVEKVLVSQGPGFVYVDRQTSHAPSRKGLIVALDLECYDYRPGSQTLIRATEGTVMERIPPRVKIRAGAAIESPHIMVLIDDPDRRVIEPLAAQIEQMVEVYNSDLMMNGGHITGYQVNNPQIMQGIYEGLAALADPEGYNRRYGLNNQPVLLYAVGDGNHSLATAKAVWDGIKRNISSAVEFAEHPARFALVELVNIHDPGLEFEPIHRVVFHADTGSLLEEWQSFCSTNGSELHYEPVTDFTDITKTMSDGPDHESQQIGLVNQDGAGLVTLKKTGHNLAVGSLQMFLDHYLRAHPEASIDYIHGADVVRELGAKSGNCGFYLPPLAKSELFKTVILQGVLPRKTFSMGEAEEKRFYIECRKITY